MINEQVLQYGSEIFMDVPICKKDVVRCCRRDKNDTNMQGPRSHEVQGSVYRHFCRCWVHNPHMDVDPPLFVRISWCMNAADNTLKLSDQWM